MPPLYLLVPLAGVFAWWRSSGFHVGGVRFTEAHLDSLTDLRNRLDCGQEEAMRWIRKHRAPLIRVLARLGKVRLLWVIAQMDDESLAMVLLGLVEQNKWPIFYVIQAELSARPAMLREPIDPATLAQIAHVKDSPATAARG